MDRTKGKNSADIGGGRQGFRDQDAVAGIPGTVVPAAWLNGIQEELMKVIEDAGLSGSGEDWGQLAQALGKMTMPQFSWSINWMAVKSMDTAIAPDKPLEGDVYLVPANSAGVWGDKSGLLAIAQKSGWVYATPKDGHGFGLPDGRMFIKQTGSYKELKFDAKDKTGKLADLDDINNAASAAARTILTKAATDGNAAVSRFTFLTPQEVFKNIAVNLLDLNDIDNAKTAAVRAILTRSAEGGTFLTPEEAFKGIHVPYPNIDNFPVERLLPAGMIAPFAMKETPKGWLRCNGAWISRKEYPALYSAISDNWGYDDRGVAFRIPDLRGEFIRGWIDDRDPATLPDTQKGRAFASWQRSTLEKHQHQGDTDWNGQHNHEYQRKVDTYNARGSDGTWNNGYQRAERTSVDGNHLHHFWTNWGEPQDGRFASETAPQNWAALYCIKI